jgi:protein-S-isoprenylcysteine O-methyltransferase Ste14
VLALVAGWLIDGRWPWPIGFPVASRIIAAVLALLWVGLTASSIGLFRRSRTSVVPVRPATALVTSGPYRLTRNPMYLGLALLTVSISLFMDTWWPILLLVPALLVVRQAVILPEERYLRRRFGTDYDAYTRRVRRWL